MRLLKHSVYFLFLFFAACGLRPAYAQSPDCVQQFSFSSTGTSTPVSNVQAGCQNWIVVYESTGFSVVSIAFQTADGVTTPGSFANATAVTGSNPSTNTTAAVSTYTAYSGFFRMSATLTGTGTVRGVILGKRGSWTANGATPGGGAGGDLCGTYPNPVVCQVEGAAIPVSASGLKTNASKQLLAQTAADVVAQFTGCSGTQYLGADGGCHTAGTGGALPVVNFSALPATCTPSVTQTQIISSGIYSLADCTGTNTWTVYFNGVAVNPPSATTFSWVNQGTSGLDCSQGFCVLTPTSGNFSLRMRNKAIPAFVTNVTLETGMLFDGLSGSSCFGGIEADDGTKVLTTIDGGPSNIQYTKWNSVNSINGNYIGNYTGSLNGTALWNRFVLDSTNLAVYKSANGKNWDLMWSAAKTDWLTADTNWGWYVNCNANVGIIGSGTLFHFKETVN